MNLRRKSVGVWDGHKKCYDMATIPYTSSDLLILFSREGQGQAPLPDHILLHKESPLKFLFQIHQLPFLCFLLVINYHNFQIFRYQIMFWLLCLNFLFSFFFLFSLLSSGCEVSPVDVLVKRLKWLIFLSSCSWFALAFRSCLVGSFCGIIIMLWMIYGRDLDQMLHPAGDKGYTRILVSITSHLGCSSD